MKSHFPRRDVAAFRRDLDCLLTHFQPISLDRLSAWAACGESLPRNSFHLTCDDGMREAVEVVAPICREKGVPATFFVTTGFLDNRLLGERHLASLLFERISRLPEASSNSLRAKLHTTWPDRFTPDVSWQDPLFAKSAGQRLFLEATAELLEFDQAEFLRTVRPYAERQEVARLLADGFTIGAHTVDHPYFPAISLDEQVRQAVVSVREIESDFGIPCQTFAFPFGADGVQPEFYDAVTRDTAVRLFFGVGPAAAKRGCRLVDRIPFDHPSEVRGERILRRAYATRFEHRLRGIDP